MKTKRADPSFVRFIEAIKKPPSVDEQIEQLKAELQERVAEMRLIADRIIELREGA